MLKNGVKEPQGSSSVFHQKSIGENSPFVLHFLMHTCASIKMMYKMLQNSKSCGKLENWYSFIPLSCNCLGSMVGVNYRQKYFITITIT